MRNILIAALVAVGLVTPSAQAIYTPTQPVSEQRHTVQVTAFQACGITQYYVITLDGRTYILRDRDLDSPDVAAFVRRVLAVMEKLDAPVQVVHLDKELPLFGVKCTSA